MAKNDKIEECGACCCVDAGTFILNNDLTAQAKFLYQSEEDAKSALENFENIAKSVAKSEECKINSQISKTEDNLFALEADFTFGCEAEKMIFELKCFR